MAIDLSKYRKQPGQPVRSGGAIDLSRYRRVEPTAPETFERESQGFLPKLRDFAVDIVGGRELAEGAGMALAAPGVQRQQEEAITQHDEIAQRLIKRIQEKRARGEDTTRLMTALRNHSAQGETLKGNIQAFTEALPTTGQVVGSAARLGATAALPAIVGGVAKGGVGLQAAKNLDKVGGISAGFAPAATKAEAIRRGTKVGALTGLAEGTVHGAGAAAEDEESVLGGAIKGGAIGTVTGGAIGNIAGRFAGKGLPDDRVLERITPEASQLTPTQFKERMARDQIIPRTGTKPSTVKLSDKETDAAIKFANLIEKDPVKTNSKIKTGIKIVDDKVEDFLIKNDGIFTNSELKNKLIQSLEGVDDISVDPQRIASAKEQLINNFVDSVESNKMSGLWRARKAYDRQIESSFRGSPTLQKEMKKALRNAVQDLIKERTPGKTYQGYMDDISGLIDLEDLAQLKATKERSLSKMAEWIQNNPKKARTVKWLGGGVLAKELFFD